MIHTQYFALLRAIAQSIQKAAPHVKINQWDYNYNSKTFNSLKLHRNPLPYPKGIINITGSQKMFLYPIAQNTNLNMNCADLLKFPNVFPVASVEDKFEIYGLTNRYTINLDVSLHFETGAQLLDFYHTYSEYYPSNGKFFYDFEYDYYLYLPPETISGFDPTKDESINIFANKKDDSSDLELFSKCISSPMIKCNSVTPNQDSKSESHILTLNFEIQDSFLYMILKVDSKYWIRARSFEIILNVEDFADDEYEIDEFYKTEQKGGYPDWEVDASKDTLTDDSDTNNNTTIKED